jgi:hypothetical protein
MSPRWLYRFLPACSWRSTRWSSPR